ncbi:MAG: hypothetical protein R3D99_08235 [Altererythrobacter sp.]
MRSAVWLVGLRKEGRRHSVDRGKWFDPRYLDKIDQLDNRTKNYQKNLTNRRGDMLIDRRHTASARCMQFSVPYSFSILVLRPTTTRLKRRSTFENAAKDLTFTGRDDPAGRDEQYEAFYFMLPMLLQNTQAIVCIVWASTMNKSNSMT